MLMWLRSASLALLVVAVAFAADAAPWAEMASPHCRCRFSMPGAPTYTSQPAARDKPAVDQWLLETDKAAYFVSATTLPRQLLRDKDMLREGARGAVSQGRTLVAEKKITFQGHPGLEIVVEDAKDWRLAMRLLLVDTVLYQYGVRTPKGEKATPDEKTFFESFKLER
jgi:hypothetical protein